MNPFTSRQGRLLWQELPEFQRTFDRQVEIKVDGSSRKVRFPGDLEAYLLGFGHVLDRFESTLAQFYADGFIAKDPVTDNAPEIQPWLVPYFADLFGVTLYGPDPESRRNELSQAIWVARRRGTRVAVDRAAESILGRAVIAVPGIDRVLFSPSLRTPLLTHEEVTGEAHEKDKLINGEDIGAGAKYSDLNMRHAGLPTGTRDTGFHMRAMRSTGFLLDTDSKPALDTNGDRVPTRFRVADRAGVPCFANSFEDRALRTPDIRGPRRGRRNNELISRPDAVVLHVDPPPGVFDENTVVVNAAPQIEDGRLKGDGGVPAGKTAVYKPGADLRLDQGTGSDTSGVHEIEGLRLDATLVIATGAHATLRDFAVRKIVLENGASLDLHDGICDEIDADAAQCACQLEYVTVMVRARFRALNASECIFHDIGFPGQGPDGCLRFSRVISGNVPLTRIMMTNSSRGPVVFLTWPCLPDLADNSNKQNRQAGFGEPGYGVLSPDNVPAVTNGAEDGGEPGAYHGRFHLARLTAAKRRAEDFVPAGYHVFVRYDLRSAAPLPTE